MSPGQTCRDQETGRDLYLVDVELALASGQFSVAGRELADEVVAVEKHNVQHDGRRRGGLIGCLDSNMSRARSSKLERRHQVCREETLSTCSGLIPIQPPKNYPRTPRDGLKEAPGCSSSYQ